MQNEKNKTRQKRVVLKSADEKKEVAAQSDTPTDRSKIKSNKSFLFKRTSVTRNRAEI